MEAVGSLTELVIFELIRCKYKKSRLPAMICNIAYKERKFGEYATNDESEILSRTIGRICEHWVIPGNLSYLKNRIAICFRGIVLEISEFATQLADSIKQYNQKRITLCVESIHLAQNGKIDKAKTLLTILIKTDFLLEFNPGALFHNLVLRKDLINATNDVLNSIKNNTDSDRVAKIKNAIDKSLTYDKDYTFIANEYYADSTVDGVLSNVKYAACAMLMSKDREGLLRVCELMTIENRMKFLKENQKSLIGDNCRLDGKLIVYLSLYFPKEDWTNFVKKNFEFIFLCLIYDWRSIKFAVSIFQESLVFIDLNHMKHIFSFASSYIEDEEKEKHDSFSIIERLQVLKSIWVNTPMPLREEIKQQLLKSNDAVNLNAEFLLFVLESYPVFDQGEILCDLMKRMDSKSKRFSASDYEKIFKIYTELKTKSENMIVDENIVTTFQEEMNVLKAKKRKN